MSRPPAVTVHGLAEARQALAPGLPVTLLSAPGAGLYAGCLWWRELMAAARLEYPHAMLTDILDCGDAPGRAMAALRIGLRAIVLSRNVSSFARVEAAAATLGAVVLAERPPALDLGKPGAVRGLRDWLGSGGG